MSPHFGPFFICPSLDFPFKGQKQTKKNKCLNIHSTCFAFAQQASPTFPGFPTIDSFSNGEKKVEGEKKSIRRQGNIVFGDIHHRQQQRRQRFFQSQMPIVGECHASGLAMAVATWQVTAVLRQKRDLTIKSFYTH